ncbi:hypothetical protein PM082_014234 [Marasmius tenuissimus]|nr:hypothetical protein PM082_014234 [Marasmius tenuissimus]
MMSSSPSPESASSDTVIINLPMQTPESPSATLDNTLEEVQRAVEHDQSAIAPGDSGLNTGYGQVVDSNGWGTSGGGWGLPHSEGIDRPWTPPIPKITSLTRKESTWGDEVSRFAWRSSTSPLQSDHHVTHFTRSDLSPKALLMTSNKPSTLDDVPTETWARVQLIKSLREAQQSRIPGPTFNLSQVSHRLDEVQHEISMLNARVALNEEEITAIRDRQAALDVQVRALDKEVFAVKDRNTGLEASIKRLVEVEKDLKDLQSIALVYSDFD